MNKSEAVNELFTALATAQGQIENPKRNKTVSVRTKAGGTYQFSYADFAAVTSAVRGPLSANGLSYTQTLEPDPLGKFRLHTTLWHASGQFLQSETPLLVEEPTSQSFGSALTFMKRYALCALLGIAADDDDDANAADGNTAIAVAARKPKAPATNVMTPHDPKTGELKDSPAVTEQQSADERAPSESPRPGVSGGAQEPKNESDWIKKYDAELATAAATGDLVALRAAWKLIPKKYQATLKGALERRHKPTCESVAATKAQELEDGREPDYDERGTVDEIL